MVRVSNYLDTIFNCLFILECLCKIISYGFILDNHSYLRDIWNIMDFFIVVTSTIDMVYSDSGLSFLRVLRMLRTLRPLRFVSHNINIKIVVTALMQSMGAIFNVLIVVFLVYLMFAILGISLMKDKAG